MVMQFFFLVVELGVGGGGVGEGGWTNKVYNGLYENGQLIVFNSCFVLPFAMPRE